MVNNYGRNTLDVSKESCNGAMVKNDCRKMYNVHKEGFYLYICILLWYTYIKIHRSHASAEDNRRQSQYNTIKYNHLQL